MPEVMNADIETLAAEYVLGTLDSGERAQAQNLLVADETFAAKVDVWEHRLGELHLMVEPVEPDERIWQRIKAKMPEAAPVAETKLPEPEPAQQPPELHEPEPTLEPEPTPETEPTPELESSTPATVPAQDGTATPMDRFEAALAAVTEPFSPPGRSEPSETAPAEAAPRTLVAPALAPATAAPPPPVQAPVPSEAVPRVLPLAAQIKETAAMRRRLWRWRAFATLMTLVVLAIAALVGAWRLVPDQLPPPLQPVEVMRMIGVTISPPPAPPRPPAPPESEYDE
jgi:anti-sigma-K factor RskA